MCVRGSYPNNPKVDAAIDESLLAKKMSNQKFQYEQHGLIYESSGSHYGFPAGV